MKDVLVCTLLLAASSAVFAQGFREVILPRITNLQK